MTDDLKHMETPAIHAELLKITDKWTFEGEVPAEADRQATIIVAIGRELHARGGMDAMQEAYRQAKRRNRFAALLNLLWHGIGEWQA